MNCRVLQIGLIKVLKRIITGAVITLLVVPLLILSNTILINITIAAISVASIYEIFRAAGYDKNKGQMILCLMFGFVAPFVRYVGLIYAPLIIYIFILVLFLILLKNHPGMNIEKTAIVFLASIVISYFFTNIIMVRNLEFGQYYIYLIFIASWFTDTFAFFTGRLIGKHKLTQVSPKKTIEGSIGGIVFAVLGFIAFGIVISSLFEVYVNYVFLTVTGLFASVVAQIGDLSMSVVKRNFGVKDFGTLFPGHGGILDRFDSVLFVAPLIFICALYFPIIYS